MDALVKHVKAKNWTDVEHFHRAKSDASKVYSVSGVPHVMLIDQKGVIAFKGHPAGRPDLEQDLNDLAEGKPITGTGTAPPSGESCKAPAEEKDDGFKEMEMDTINEEIAEFKKKMTELQQKEEMREVAKEMQRSFCVITVESKHPSGGKPRFNYCNHRVLVGKQGSVNKF